MVVHAVRVYTPANIEEVEGLALSQEDKPQTHNCATDHGLAYFGFSQHNHQEWSAVVVF